mgnify:CR=1 FL=1
MLASSFTNFLLEGTVVERVTELKGLGVALDTKLLIERLHVVVVLFLFVRLGLNTSGRSIVKLKKYKSISIVMFT